MAEVRMTRAQHIANLRHAIARTDLLLKKMRDDTILLGVCACCVGAYYGGVLGSYDQLRAKQCRRLALLEKFECAPARPKSSTSAPLEVLRE